MKVLLLNPPSESGYISRDLMSGLGVNIKSKENFVDGLISHIKSAMRKMPVLSLGYLSAILNEVSDVRVIDAANLGMSADTLLIETQKMKPDFVFAASSIASLPFEAKLLEKIKELTGAKVGLIGDAASIFSDVVLRECDIDFIIKGEVETVAPKIVNRVKFQNIRGLSFKVKNKIIDNGNSTLTENLDTLPFPKWDGFPIKEYGYFPILKKKPFLTVLSSRGCPYGCIYCPYSTFMGRKWRARTPENVLIELKYLKDNYGVKSVLFRDPIFSLDKKRTLEICKGMVGGNLGIDWACETRADCLDEETLSSMAEANCKGINIGIESADPRVLSTAKRKSIDSEKIQKIISYTKDLGIKTTGFFIIGLPGETIESIKNTIDFSLSLGLSYAEYKIATPFPGTKLYEMCIKNGWVDEIETLSDFPAFTSYNAYIKLDNGLSPEYVEECCSNAFKMFYSQNKILSRELLNGDFINISLLKEISKYTFRAIASRLSGGY